MTETVVSSASKEVVIGFDQPFVVIGERINPTGRKLLAEEMKAGDYSRVETDALAQVEAGAQIGVNGPAVSHDKGKTWKWLGVKNVRFRQPAGDTGVDCCGQQHPHAHRHAG